jgi:two-component system sensor histidine kinase KdpD
LGNLLTTKRAQALLWWGVLAATAVLLRLARERLDKAHVALALLLVVLGGSAAGGRRIGLSLVAASFVVFDYWFLLPYNTLAVRNPLDWVVLIAYLITSLTAAQLLIRAQREASIARQRADEVDRLAALGAEALHAGRADEALGAIASIIRTTLRVSSCEIAGFTAPEAEPWLRARDAAPADAEPTLVDALHEWVLSHRGMALLLADRSTRRETSIDDPELRERLSRESVRALLLPLSAHDRPVGVLHIGHTDPFRIESAQWRFLDALMYYAALGVDRVRLEREADRVAALREADRLKDALVASVSHDLRTPLTSIKALARELRSTGDERAEIIEQEADRLNRFVSDLLDLSRLSVDSLPLRIEVNTIDDLLGVAVQRVEAAYPGSRILVSLGGDGGILFARFDLAQTVRIVVNLLENAFKYGGREGAVDLSARQGSGVVEIEVADRGPGVPSDERSRIFEPFYRPSGSVPDARSAGLGLAISQRLAAAQGGTLTYAPRESGGSRFTLTLPYVDAASVATGEEDPAFTKS